MRCRAARPRPARAGAAGTDSHDRMDLSDNPSHVRLMKSKRRLRLTMTFVFDFIPITV
jgi:hypothetical protein